MSRVFVLNDGCKMPLIGYGPGIVPANLYKVACCPVLLKRGINFLLYRPLQTRKYVSIIASVFKNDGYYLDYSFTYSNYAIIKKAIAKVGRQNMFVSSRVSNQAQRNGCVREEVLNGLNAWGIEQLDLLEFHWPVADCYQQTWLEMEQLQREGYVKSIGVANCHIHHLEQILRVGTVVPAINQIEMHPLFTQKELLAYCKEHDILIQAYTAIARFDDRLVRLPLMKKICNKYNKTLVQVVLKWHLQNGVSPVIRSWNKKRIGENINVFDFELTEQEMATIDGININSRLRYDPDNCDFSIL